MNNKETSQAAQNTEVTSEAPNTDVSSNETPHVDNAPDVPDERQQSSVELSFSDVSPVPVVAVSDADSSVSDTTQPLPSIASPEALEAKPSSPPVVEAPSTNEETAGSTTGNEETSTNAETSVSSNEPSSTPVISQQPSLPGDAIYVDQQGNKHGAFIEHLIAGGVKLIAQLRLALSGGYVDEVPHSVDDEPHSWHRN
jgi:hypothetical protein